MGLVTLVKRLLGLGSKADRKLKCEDCKKDFIFDEGEQKFFRERGFTDPKRCPRCRKRVKHKMHRGGRRRGGAGNGPRRFRDRSRRFSMIDGQSPYADE